MKNTVAFFTGLMALPLALAVAFPGAVLGRIIARRGVDMPRGAGMAIIVPLFVGVEPRVPPPAHEVVTAVEITAPPEVVWRHVVTFSDLREPFPRSLFQIKRSRTTASDNGPATLGTSSSGSRLTR